MYRLCTILVLTFLAVHVASTSEELHSRGSKLPFHRMTSVVVVSVAKEMRAPSIRREDMSCPDFDARFYSLLEERLLESALQSGLSSFEAEEFVRREIERVQEWQNDLFKGFLEGLEDLAMCLLSSFASCETKLLVFTLSITDLFDNEDQAWIDIAAEVWDAITKGADTFFACGGEALIKQNWLTKFFKAVKNAGKILGIVKRVNNALTGDIWEEVGKLIVELLNKIFNLCDDRRRTVSVNQKTIPESWTCDSKFYAAGDGCDCNCGAWDPDCDLEQDIVFGCGTGDGISCEAPGICNVEKYVHPNWSCPHEWYNAGRGQCYCGCDAPDPDCRDENPISMNCPCSKMTCEKETQECVGFCSGHDFEDLMSQHKSIVVPVLLTVSVVFGCFLIVLLCAALMLLVGGKIKNQKKGPTDSNYRVLRELRESAELNVS